ncbi:MAG TPA: hypothetical protein VMG10_11725 [Gemmataceae bacterium]|nr:hypothetical protein [Gemmataceae bacterium]
MYPAFTPTRPRLPSVLSVSQTLEQYRAKLGQRRLLRDNDGEALAPLDAYLAHLFVSYHPGEPAILDLAGESTTGASALLGLLHPREPRVLTVNDHLSGDRQAYGSVLEEFLCREGKSLSRLQWIPHTDSATELHGERDVILFVAASQSAVAREVEHWLNNLPSAVVLVFGLGAVGDSAAIDALLQRFPTGSPRRFALLRDCGEALSASGLGVVADRDNASAEAALRRLRQLFTSNYSFLGLLCSVTEQAIRSSASDTAVRESNHHLFQEWNQEINQLKQTAQQARDLAEARAEELRVLQSSANYRLSERLRRWRQQIAPDQTWRHRLFVRLHRAARIWRQDGGRSLLQRIVHRCLRRKV